ncbi:MAG: 3',5'-cyclic-nucleotide phosphodiesterase [Desulfuromonadaceae bacterium]
MRLRVLGCSGSSYPGHQSPAFLIDDNLLVDAGTVSAVLNEEEQNLIEAVLITHPHLDHIKGLAGLAENLLITGSSRFIHVYGLEAVLDILKKHLFNGLIWPDFGIIPDESAPIIRWKILEPYKSTVVCGYTVFPVPVSHTVPASGFLISSRNARMLFTGDTGPTEAIWHHATELSLLVVEVSFPDSLEELALRSGHLTPRLLKIELGKLPDTPRRIMVMHLKSIYREQIISELVGHGLQHIEVMKEGAVYHI